MQVFRSFVTTASKHLTTRQFLESVELKVSKRKTFLLSANFLILIIFMQAPVSAQNHEWAGWHRPISGNANESWEIKDVQTDSYGNLYATGTFRSPITSGKDTLYPKYPTIPKNDDIYLIKYSNDGNPIWTKIIGGNWYDFPKSLIVNDTAVFLAALLQGDSIRMGDTAYLNTENLQVMQFDTAGTYMQTYFHSTTSSNNVELNKICASGDKLYLGSWFEITEFSNFPDIKKQTTFHTTNYYQITDFAVYPDNKKVVVGHFKNNITYQGTTITADTIGVGNPAFIMMLDNNDSLLWMHNFGKVISTNENPIKVEISPGGDAFLMASYNDVFQLNRETVVPYNLGTHSFIARFNQAGELQWHKSFIPSAVRNNAHLYDLFITEDNVFATGSFQGEISYDLADTLKTPAGYNFFIAKINMQGEAVWIDVTKTTSGNNYANAICGDENGNLFVGGLSYGAVDPIIGCTAYPSITGGLLLRLIDEESDDLPEADFHVKNQDDNYYFQSKMKNQHSFTWDFDDGSELQDKAENPSHSFVQKGEFNVCLTVNNSCGENKMCQIISIKGLKEMLPAVSSPTNLLYGEIYGANFSDSAKFKLIKDGEADILLDSANKISQGKFVYTLALSNVAIGNWDLVMTTGAQTDTLSQAFLVEADNESAIEIEMVGPAITLTNRFFQYSISVKNKSNTNLFGVPLAIIAKEYQDIEVLTEILEDSVTHSIYEAFGSRFLADTLINGELIKIGLFAIPFLGAQETFVFKIALKSSKVDENSIQLYTGSPLLDADFLQESAGLNGLNTKSLQASPSCFGSKCLDCLISFGGFVPLVGCATGVVGLGCTIAYGAAGDDSKSKYAWDIGMGLVGAALSCGGATAAQGAAEKATKGIMQYMGIGAGLTDLALNTNGVTSSCGDGNCTLDDLKDFLWNPRASIDPNEKYGIKGINADNYVNIHETLNYTITFENVDSATAPASEVLILDTLDMSVYDTSTLEWISFGFENSIFEIPAGNSNYITDVDLRPERNIILRFEGSIDSNGVIKARFTSLDTSSFALTNNILDGFLPPNKISPEGEGFIQFAIQPLSNLEHLTQIKNKASIFFDNNKPIVTGTWLNTIDTEPPTSSVTHLPEFSSDTIFTLDWEGIDNHSGIQVYDIYLSKNNGAFERILSNVRFESVKIIGEYENKYGFYVIAKDYAGNTEEKTPIAENSIKLQMPTSIKSKSQNTNLSVFPIPANDIINVQLNGFSEQSILLSISDISGRIVYENVFPASDKSMILQFKTYNYENGIYFIQASNGDGDVQTSRFIISHK